MAKISFSVVVSFTLQLVCCTDSLQSTESFKELLIFNENDAAEFYASENHYDSSNDSCLELDVRKCLANNECRWYQRKCMKTDHSFPVPRSVHEMYLLLTWMWENPPSMGSPIMWSVFLVVSLSFGAVSFLWLCFGIWFAKLFGFLLRRSGKNKNRLHDRQHQKIILVSYGARKVALGENVVDHTRDNANVTKEQQSKCWNNLTETNEKINVASRIAYDQKREKVVVATRKSRQSIVFCSGSFKRTSRIDNDFENFYTDNPSQLQPYDETNC